LGKVSIDDDNVAGSEGHVLLCDWPRSHGFHNTFDNHLYSTQDHFLM